MAHNVHAGSSEKPLLGAVLCCTSIPAEERTVLAQYAEQMGAEHKLDLTSDVTHLLVGSTDTPKYQYVAREREDVKVLRPEWVEAVRSCWMNDETLDMNALEAEYRVPTLAGLKICITGFDDLAFRAQLQKNVISNGGEYTGDLTKDVTHLIAASMEGKKYEYATLWNRKVVSLQWYKDSLDRGMQLDEAAYHPSRSAEEQGAGAWNRQDRSQFKTGKRAQDEQPAHEPTRKLRRTASAKLGSQTNNMWDDIVGQPSQRTDSNRDVLRTSKSMPAIREEKNAEASKVSEDNTNEQDSQKMSNQSTSKGKAFLTNTFFAIANFNKRKELLVAQTLQNTGARVFEIIDDLLRHDKVDADNTFLIVPHQSRKAEIPQMNESPVTPKIVTELWLERCMLQKDYISPSRYPMGRLVMEINSPGIKNFSVNASGFPSIETLHIAKTVAMTGARYEEVFTPKSSVLLCNSQNINQQKLFHAKQWKVPAVSENWLYQFLTHGRIPDFNAFLIENGHDDNGNDDNDLETEIRQKRLQKQALPAVDASERGSRENKEAESEAALMHQKPPLDAHEDIVEPRRDQTGRLAHDAIMENRSRVEAQSREEDKALREVSSNSPTRRTTAAKSSGEPLFQKHDRAVVQQENSPFDMQQFRHGEELRSISPLKSPQNSASIHHTIHDLLGMNSKMKPKPRAHDGDANDKKKRLLGRALSNVSNASHGSRQSRASSIDSLNTDGVGSEIPPLSGKSQIAENKTTESFNLPSLRGRAPSKQASAPVTHSDASLYQSTPIDPSDPHLLRDEFDNAVDEQPQLTQLGYEDSEEAIALREKLAEKRRARARLGQQDGDPEPEIQGKEREAFRQRQQPQNHQQSKKVLKDDETLDASGWGGGRRTRQKNRSKELSALDML